MTVLYTDKVIALKNFSYQGRSGTWKNAAETITENQPGLSAGFSVGQTYEIARLHAEKMIASGLVMLFPSALNNDNLPTTIKRNSIPIGIG